MSRLFYHLSSAASLQFQSFSFQPFAWFSCVQNRTTCTSTSHVTKKNQGKWWHLTSVIRSSKSVESRISFIVKNPQKVKVYSRVKSPLHCWGFCALNLLKCLSDLKAEKVLRAFNSCSNSTNLHNFKDPFGISFDYIFYRDHFHSYVSTSCRVRSDGLQLKTSHENDELLIEYSKRNLECINAQKAIFQALKL